jgi:hypothetical protein
MSRELVYSILTNDGMCHVLLRYMAIVLSEDKNANEAWARMLNAPKKSIDVDELKTSLMTFIRIGLNKRLEDEYSERFCSGFEYFLDQLYHDHMSMINYLTTNDEAWVNFGIDLSEILRNRDSETISQTYSIVSTYHEDLIYMYYFTDCELILNLLSGEESPVSLPVITPVEAKPKEEPKAVATPIDCDNFFIEKIIEEKLCPDKLEAIYDYLLEGEGAEDCFSDYKDYKDKFCIWVKEQVKEQVIQSQTYSNTARDLWADLRRYCLSECMGFHEFWKTIKDIPGVEEPIITKDINNPKIREIIKYSLGQYLLGRYGHRFYFENEGDSKDLVKGELKRVNELYKSAEPEVEPVEVSRNRGDFSRGSRHDNDSESIYNELIEEFELFEEKQKGGHVKVFFDKSRADVITSRSSTSSDRNAWHNIKKDLIRELVERGFANKLIGLEILIPKN